MRSKLGIASTTPPPPLHQSQGPVHLSLTWHPQTPTLSPVAQNLRVGCGLACKDDSLALLHCLGFNGQSHCRRICKAGHRKSGSSCPGFLSFLRQRIHTTLVCEMRIQLYKVSPSPFLHRALAKNATEETKYLMDAMTEYGH